MKSLDATKLLDTTSVSVQSSAEGFCAHSIGETTERIKKYKSPAASLEGLGVVWFQQAANTAKHISVRQTRAEAHAEGELNADGLPWKPERTEMVKGHQGIVKVQRIVDFILLPIFMCTRPWRQT